LPTLYSEAKSRIAQALSRDIELPLPSLELTRVVGNRFKSIMPIMEKGQKSLWRVVEGRSNGRGESEGEREAGSKTNKRM